MKLSLVFVGAVFGEQCYEVGTFRHQFCRTYVHIVFRAFSMKQDQLNEPLVPISLKLWSISELVLNVISISIQLNLFLPTKKSSQWLADHQKDASNHSLNVALNVFQSKKTIHSVRKTIQTITDSCVLWNWTSVLSIHLLVLPTTAPNFPFP